MSDHGNGPCSRIPIGLSIDRRIIFFLLQRIKTGRNAVCLVTIKAVQTAVTKGLNKVPVDAFQNAYEVWQSRWKKCVDD